LDLPRPKHTPPLISTSLKTVDTLEIFSIDPDNPVQMSIFLKECEFLIHCGRPFKLDVEMEEGSLYVPVINDSGCLLRVLSTITLHPTP